MISSLAELGINTTTSSEGATTNAPGLNIAFNIGPNGFFDKPANWTSQRESPGTIQQAISALIAAQNKLREAVANETYDKQGLDKAIEAFQSQMAYESNTVSIQNNQAKLNQDINDFNEAYNVENKANDYILRVYP